MNEQQRLLNVIWNNDPELLAKSGFDLKGVTIYRRNLIANAERALSITFPTIFELLDSDVSKHLIEQFIKLCPPDQGDWAQWGEEFAAFLITEQIAQEYPYLPDCAALDWHLHCALHGQDQTLDQASLALLGTTEPDHITLLLNDNVALIKTQYPIHDIFIAHHNNEESQRDMAMERARIALSTELEDHVVMVSRPEYQPIVSTLTRYDAEFMFCLNAGKSLETALDAVSQYPDFSFEAWLLNAIENNLIYKFEEKVAD